MDPDIRNMHHLDTLMGIQSGRELSEANLLAVMKKVHGENYTEPQMGYLNYQCPVHNHYHPQYPQPAQQAGSYQPVQQPSVPQPAPASLGTQAPEQQPPQTRKPLWKTLLPVALTVGSLAIGGVGGWVLQRVADRLVTTGTPSEPQDRSQPSPQPQPQPQPNLPPATPVTPTKDTDTITELRLLP